MRIAVYRNTSWTPGAEKLSLFFGVLVISLFVLLVYQQSSRDEVSGLSYPAQSGARLAERHLTFFEGVEATPAWQQSLFATIYGSREEAQKAAITTYREILSHFDAVPARATTWDVRNTRIRLILLLAETGQFLEATQLLMQLSDTPEEEVIANSIRFAYNLPIDEVYMPEIHAGIRMLPDGWTKNKIRARIYARIDSHERTWANGLLLAQGSTLRNQTLLFSCITALLIGFGILGTIYLYLRKPAPPAWNAKLLNQAWSFSRGLSTLVLSAGLGISVYFASQLLSALTGFQLLAQWSTLLASLPMLWLIQIRLLRPQNLSWSDAFGLKLTPSKFLPIVFICLFVMGLERSGALLISWVSYLFGYEPHWSEGLAERWLWSSWENTLANSVNVVLWAPLFEEIGFRGLLYLTLRSHLKPIPAALISALIFSSLHLYSLAGFLSVFWSGLVWSYAFERFRSLLPAIITHALSNLFALGLVLLFYR